MLWRFAVPVGGLTLTAHDLADASAPAVPVPDVSVADSAGFGADWPSYVAIPHPGCWRVDLRARTQAGAAVAASVTYIVVA